MNKTLLGTTSIILLHRCRYRNESCLEKVLPTFQCDTIQKPNRNMLQVFLAAIPRARYRKLFAFFAAVAFSMSLMRLFFFVSVVWLIHLLRCYFWPLRPLQRNLSISLILIREVSQHPTNKLVYLLLLMTCFQLVWLAVPCYSMGVRIQSSTSLEN